MTTENSHTALDCSVSVNDMISRHPETAGVFNAYGIDTCCGGGASVQNAARDANVDATTLCTDLDAAIRVTAA